MINKKGITLIALIITIIVLLILAGVTVALVVGDNGILNKAKNSKQATIVGEEKDTIAVSWSAVFTNYMEDGTEITDEIFEQELINNGNDVTVSYDEDGNYLVHFNDTGHNYVVDKTGGINGSDNSENVLGSLTLGQVYTDDMIGQYITYSSNGQHNWIVFGKDTSGNILITTELPIDYYFTLNGGAESWLKYESYTDTIYGLNCACSDYGGTIQEVQVQSRSIKMEDINYVAGLTSKTVTVDANTYNIQSFDIYTLGTIDNYSEKKLNCWYPVLSGGTLANGTGSGFWKTPTTENEITFKNDWYAYGCSLDDGQCKYWGADTNENGISVSNVGLNIDRLKYIWGENDSYMNNYLVASRSAMVSTDNIYFGVACVCDGRVESNNYRLCAGYSTYGLEGPGVSNFSIRPVVILPPGLLVEEISTGVYDLVE